MPDKDQPLPDSPRPEPNSPPAHARISEQFARFERRQSELWRLTLLVLFILGLFFAWTNWNSIRALQHRFEALPIGLVVLLVLFGVYLWKKTQEISELRGLLH